jgi:hypothetical protein
MQQLQGVEREPSIVGKVSLVVVEAGVLMAIVSSFGLGFRKVQNCHTF